MQLICVNELKNDVKLRIFLCSCTNVIINDLLSAVFFDFVISSLYCFFLYPWYSSFMWRYMRVRYVIILMIKALIDSTHYTVKLISTKAPNYYFRQDGIIKKYTSKKAQNVCILFVIIFLLIYVYTHARVRTRPLKKK